MSVRSLLHGHAWQVLARGELPSILGNLDHNKIDVTTRCVHLARISITATSTLGATAPRGLDGEGGPISCEEYQGTLFVSGVSWAGKKTGAR